MRVFHLVLVIFVLLDIGAVCRITPYVPAHCETLAGGLLHCPPQGGQPNE